MPSPTGAMRVGSVVGVPVYLDRTWLLLGGFVAWSGFTSARLLGTTVAVAYAAWLVVAILFAVLAHEAAHAIAARALGFRVHRIVATLWGGHTAYDATGITPGRHAAVALGGPAANLVLALGGWLAQTVLPFPAAEFAWAFAWMNALLAGFNLLPGLPLDGGAAVQALVWASTGRRDLGLRVAGWVGRVVAVGVVVWWVVLPLVRHRLDVVALILALVMAWVLWSGATAAIRRAPFERVVATVSIDQVARPAVLAAAGMTVQDATRSAQVLVGLDEHGRATLVFAGAAADVPPDAPVGSVLRRLPDDAVLESGPDGDLGAVLAAMGSTGSEFVVLTRAGRPWGVVSAEAVDTAARATLGRTGERRS
jgi:Zn-dependent protease